MKDPMSIVEGSRSLFFLIFMIAIVVMIVYMIANIII